MARVAQVAPTGRCAQAVPAADLSSRRAGPARWGNYVETLLWPNRSLGKSHNPAREESRNVSNRGSPFFSTSRQYGNRRRNITIGVFLFGEGEAVDFGGTKRAIRGDAAQFDLVVSTGELLSRQSDSDKFSVFVVGC